MPTLLNDLATLAVEIANAASQSSIAHAGEMRLCGIVMPAAWTSADLTFLVSVDDITYSPAYKDDGTELKITTPAASRYITIDPTWFMGIQWLKLRSGTAGTPVNQGGARTLTLVYRRI